MQRDPEWESEFLLPIVAGWRGKLKAARDSKNWFNDVAGQCQQFFSGRLGFMWNDKFRKQYMGGEIAPKFRITIAKAFELVALIGPVLYWRYPNRKVASFKPIDISPELFGDPQDPMAMQMYQQVLMQQQSEEGVNRTRNSLMEKYLNYSQREQPAGGLAEHSSQAITEALVKGRGCLWVEPYNFAGSDRKLTGCFFDRVDNLLVDPDCEDPTFSDAKWIARRHCEPVWEVERRFNLPSGSLEGKGSLESSESQSVRNSDQDKMDRANGKTFDEVVWYEIWSKGGVGTRLKGVSTGLSEAFDDVVGDYAYICISPNVEWPLNAPSESFLNASDEEVKDRFSWPVPYWADDRWPVCTLDFYRNPGFAWPLAPMSMGLGELMFMNVMISLLATRAWSTSRNIWALSQSAVDDFEEQLNSGKFDVCLKINDGVHKSVNEVLQFVQQPPVNMDIWQMLDRVSQMFDKRVGLTELLYGMTNTQSRTAADIKVKHEQLSIRPEYMAGRVESWQSEAANLEKFAAAWNVRGFDIRPLVGDVGASLWDNLIAGSDPELVVREMKATVEAGSAKKPNKERDIGNLQHISGYVLPELSKQADATGDTGPLNKFFDLLGDAMDQDMSGLEMGPRRPEPDPTAQQAQQLEMAGRQAEVEGKQVETQMKQSEMAIKQMEARLKASEDAIKQREAELELQAKELEHAQDLRHSQEEHILKLEQDRASGLQKLLFQRQEGLMKREMMNGSK